VIIDAMAEVLNEVRQVRPRDSLPTRLAGPDVDSKTRPRIVDAPASNDQLLRRIVCDDLEPR
jgi:hypothetical protein